MRIHVRLLRADDEQAFVAAAVASRQLHSRWVSAPSTAALFQSHLRRMGEPNNCGLLVCLRRDGAPVGVVNITNIVLGALRSGYTGYYAFAGHEGQGLMREGLQAAVRHAFGSLNLHRLEANIQPGNTASIALARSCGFRREGYSPRYLKIAGRWRDHERWAIVAD